MLKPKQSISDNDRRDNESVLNIETLLVRQRAKPDITSHDKEANIDGYIQLLDEQGYITGKITVQVKTYNPTYHREGIYPIPEYIVGYSTIMMGELVALIVSDYDGSRFFWKIIDQEYIRGFEQSGCKSRTYRFKKDEIADKGNIAETISRWQDAFNRKMAAFNIERANAIRFIESCKAPFYTVAQYFYNIPSSHIERKETGIIKEWLNCPLDNGEKQIKILSGPAGCGKSVVIKDLLDYFDKTDQAYLAIKADQAGIMDQERIITTLSILSAENPKCILVIDQLDALSRYLSNDREKLNNILSVIASACKNWPDKIRVIVSCREFDLQNDTRINKVLSGEPIRMKGLSKENIRQVLDQLQTGLFDNTSSNLRALLSTPQFLDIFCRIYPQSAKPLSISTNIDLYDALWQEITHPDISLKVEEIEAVLFEIAKAVIDSETLNPVKVFTRKKVCVAEYLKSQGLLIQNGDRVSFFHQTFFEYAYSRQLAANGKSIKSILIRRHQGLFARSMVKHVLDYLKGQDPARYIEEIRSLLISKQIRAHIKTLVLESMAFYGDVSLAEQDLINKLFFEDRQLFNYFLRKTWSDGWFRPVMNIISELLPDLQIHSNDYHPVTLFLSRYCELHTNDIFLALEKINDAKTKEGSANYLLRSDCNYKNNLVLDIYHKLDSTSSLYDKYACLRKAIKSNLSFVLEELTKLLDNYINDSLSHNGGRVEYHSLLSLCKDFGNKHPEEICTTLNKSIVRFVDNNRYESLHNGLDSSPFDPLFYPEAVLSLLDLLKEMLAGRSLSFQKAAVSELLNCKEDHTTAMALELMSLSPDNYLFEIKGMLDDNTYVSKLLHSKESEYWFRILLQKWYGTVDNDTKRWYSDFVFRYKSPLDSLSNKERPAYMPFLYPFLGEEQWKLLHTIPQEGMASTLMKKMLELNRRFGSAPKLEKPHHGLTMAAVCSRLVPEEVCKRFSEEDWKSFILGCPNYKESRKNGKWIPVDDRINIDDFSKFVAEKPNNHLDFVCRLTEDNNVDIRFKYAGIKGLAKGGIDPALVMEILDRVADKKTDAHEYLEIQDLLIKTDSPVIDKVIPEFIDLIKTEEYKPLGFIIDNEREAMKRLSDILNHVINSKPGRALDRLIQISGLESRRQEIYGILMELRDNIHPEMQAFTIWRLYTKEYYYEGMFSKLLEKYLAYPLPALLLLNRQCIFNHYIDHPTITDNYLDAMLQYPVCHGILAQIYFLSYSRKPLREKAETVLDSLLSKNEDDCFKDLAKICISNIDDDDYRKFACSLLEKMIGSDSENHCAATVLYQECDELTSEDFPIFYKLFMNTDPKTTGRGHSVLSYLEKCISEYPRECYVCLKRIDTDNPDDRVDEESYILLLLKLYSVLKENADRDTMERIMDTFDKHIVLDNYGFRQALEEMDKEQ